MLYLIALSSQEWEEILTASDPRLVAGQTSDDPLTEYIQNRRKMPSDLCQMDYQTLRGALSRVDLSSTGASLTCLTNRRLKFIDLLNHRYACFRYEQMVHFQDEVSYLDPAEVKKRSALLVALPHSARNNDPSHKSLASYIHYFEEAAAGGKGLLIWTPGQFDVIAD